MKKNKIIAVSIACIFASFAFSATTKDSLYSQAQKLYSQGYFEMAAKVYTDACPKFESKEKKNCQLNEIKALIESKNENLARIAEPKLLALISQTEPSDSLFAELNAEDSKLQVMLNQPARAIRSWQAAQASANVDYFSEIFVLCKDIVSAYPENSLTAQNCDKVKPADTSLISLPRQKIVPLSKTAAPQATAPAQTTTPPPTPAPQATAPAKTTAPLPTPAPQATVPAQTATPPPAPAPQATAPAQTAAPPPAPAPQATAPTQTAPPPALAPPPVSVAAAVEGKWYVQLGAFGNKENAEKLVADFKSKGVQLYITELTNRNLFAVRSGNFENKKDAESFAEQKIEPTHKDYKIFQN